MKTYLYLVIFWAMQVVAQILFKWGSESESRWLTGFIAGNLFGFSSIWLLMLVYRAMNPNVALAVATAGAFLFAQLALSLAFKTQISIEQAIGVIAIVGGIVLLAMGQQRQV